MIGIIIVPRRLLTEVCALYAREAIRSTLLIIIIRCLLLAVRKNECDWVVGLGHFARVRVQHNPSILLAQAYEDVQGGVYSWLTRSECE